MNLQNGDIVLFKVNSFSTAERMVLARGIMFAEGVYYHHAAVACDDRLYEADTTVVEADMAKYNGDEILHLRLRKPLNEEEELRYRMMVLSRLNAKYDYASVFIHQPLHILSLRRLWFGRKGPKANKRPYCTEFAVEAIHDVRGYFPQPYLTGPHHFFKWAALYYDVVQQGVYKHQVQTAII